MIRNEIIKSLTDSIEELKITGSFSGRNTSFPNFKDVLTEEDLKFILDEMKIKYESVKFQGKMKDKWIEVGFQL
jgi:hypothetical protein